MGAHRFTRFIDQALNQTSKQSTHHKIIVNKV